MLFTRADELLAKREDTVLQHGSKMWITCLYSGFINLIKQGGELEAENSE